MPKSRETPVLSGKKFGRFLPLIGIGVDQNDRIRLKKVVFQFKVCCSHAVVVESEILIGLTVTTYQPSLIVF